MYMAIAVIFMCAFFDLDPAKAFPLHLAARIVAESLGKTVESTVRAVSASGKIASIFDSALDAIKKGERMYLKDYGVHMIKRLLKSGLSVEDVTWSQIMPTAGAMVPNQAQAVRLRLSNLYLPFHNLSTDIPAVVYSGLRLLSRGRKCHSSHRTPPPL